LDEVNRRWLKSIDGPVEASIKKICLMKLAVRLKAGGLEALSLDCGGKTPLWLHLCQWEGLWEIQKRTELLRVKPKRGHVPAVHGAGLNPLLIMPDLWRSQ